MGLRVRERENYRQGNPQLNLIDRHPVVSSPTETIPNHNALVSGQKQQMFQISLAQA